MCVDFFLNRSTRKFALRNRADDAVVIARGLHENRNRSSHHDGMQDAFVAVAIHEHDIIPRHVRMPHHFVRRACAVRHKEQMIGTKNARSVTLRCSYRPRVIE